MYQVRKLKKKDCEDTSYKMFRNYLCMIGKLIIREPLVIVPQCLYKITLELAFKGQQGIVKTKQCLCPNVWWPGIDKEAESMCRRCHRCQLVGPSMPHLNQYTKETEL